ncbi:hypothetical protein HY497_00275 [Candidatus Woesearchaeota archaeon]|nr:hypothetical protein [Candidatus Woesearchaeota archaeon]
MPVQNFLDARKKYERELDTVERQLRLAYDIGLATTIPAGETLVDRAALENQPARDAFKAAMSLSLHNHAGAYMGLPANFDWDDPFKGGRIELGLYGMTSSGFGRAVETAKKNLTFQAFEKIAEPGLEEIVKERILTPALMGTLTAGDTHDVLRHVGIDAARVYENRIGVNEMAALLEEYKQNGVIRPVWLEAQPFYNPHGAAQGGARGAAGGGHGHP